MIDLGISDSSEEDETPVFSTKKDTPKVKNDDKDTEDESADDLDSDRRRIDHYGGNIDGDNNGDAIIGGRDDQKEEGNYQRSHDDDGILDRKRDPDLGLGRNRDDTENLRDRESSRESRDHSRSSRDKHSRDKDERPEKHDNHEQEQEQEQRMQMKNEDDNNRNRKGDPENDVSNISGGNENQHQDNTEITLQVGEQRQDGNENEKLLEKNQQQQPDEDQNKNEKILSEKQADLKPTSPDHVYLVLNGLPWWTTDEQLSSHLSPCGTTIVQLDIQFDPLNGKSTGHAAVKFDTAQDALKTHQFWLQKKDEFFPKRNVECKVAEKMPTFFQYFSLDALSLGAKNDIMGASNGTPAQKVDNSGLPGHAQSKQPKDNGPRIDNEKENDNKSGMLQKGAPRTYSNSNIQAPNTFMDKRSMPTISDSVKSTMNQAHVHVPPPAFPPGHNLFAPNIPPHPVGLHQQGRPPGLPPMMGVSPAQISINMGMPPVVPGAMSHMPPFPMQGIQGVPSPFAAQPAPGPPRGFPNIPGMPPQPFPGAPFPGAQPFLWNNGPDQRMQEITVAPTAAGSKVSRDIEDRESRREQANRKRKKYDESNLSHTSGKRNDHEGEESSRNYEEDSESDRRRSYDKDRDRRRGGYRSPRDEEKKDSERRGSRGDDRRGSSRRDYDRSRGGGQLIKRDDSFEEDRGGYDRRRRRDSSREGDRHNKDRGDDNSYRERRRDKDRDRHSSRSDRYKEDRDNTGDRSDRRRKR